MGPGVGLKGWGIEEGFGRVWGLKSRGKRGPGKGKTKKGR